MDNIKQILIDNEYENTIDDYWEKFLNIKNNKRLNIRFRLTQPSKNFVCCFDILACTCYVGCCGKSFGSLLFNEKEFLDKENQIKKYFENK